jgi:sugar fermentation stimulation protein A
MKKYFFEEELIQGLIKSRPNRFIMLVEINGEIKKCHCPSTGRIGNIEFKDIPCLLSRAKDVTRKTEYTVETITPEKNIVVGINQVKANAYVNFFLQNKLLGKMIDAEEVKREVKLNTSKIDFLVNQNCFLEVKTPLNMAPFGNKKIDTKFNSFERLGRHFQEISLQIQKGQRAIVLLCYLYNAEPFKVLEKPNVEILKIVKQATARGLENWQINLKIDKKGVSMIDYFKLDLF